MAHCHGDGEGAIGEGDFGAFRGWREITAGEGGHGVFILTTGGGIIEFKMSGHEGHEGCKG